MKKVNIILITLSIILCVSACKKSDNDIYFTSYFPLEVGNSWEYQYRYYIPDEPNFSDTTLIKLTIIRDTLIEDNITAYVVEEARTLRGQTTSRNFLWCIQDSALVTLDYTARYIPLIKHYALNMKIGDNWSMYPQFNNTSVYTTKVVKAEYENYPFQGQKVPAFLIARGNPLSTEGAFERTEEIFAPRIGKIAETRWETVYGRIHMHETKLLAHYSN